MEGGRGSDKGEGEVEGLGFRKEERGRAWASSEGINRVRKEEKEVQARIHTHKDRHMHVQAHTHARIRTVGHIFPWLSPSQGHRRSVAAKASCRGQPLQDGGIFRSRRRRGSKDRPVGRPHGGEAVAGVGEEVVAPWPLRRSRPPGH